MCLGIPGRVVRWSKTDPLFATAMVEFEGVSREVHMACAADAVVGDYVVVHAGVAICKIDPSAGRQSRQQWSQICNWAENRETDR